MCVTSRNSIGLKVPIKELNMLKGDVAQINVGRNWINRT